MDVNLRYLHFVIIYIIYVFSSRFTLVCEMTFNITKCANRVLRQTGG